MGEVNISDTGIQQFMPLTFQKLLIWPEVRTRGETVVQNYGVETLNRDGQPLEKKGDVIIIIIFIIIICAVHCVHAMQPNDIDTIVIVLFMITATVRVHPVHLRMWT